MQFNPKVSIIIPVYNGSNYMREAIDSALAQTYKNVEVIVVNDGSNDNGKTEAIAKSYGDRIRYFRKENGGVATALNFGIKKAEGEYISWLSHDDVYYPNKLESQINHLNSGEKNIVLYSDYDIIDSESKLIGAGKIGHVNPERFRYALTISHPTHGCTLLIPKRCFDECGFFDESLRTTQDYDMWFRMAKKYSFVHMPQNLIKSRAHAEQGTHAMNDLRIAECNDLLAGFVKDLTEEEILAATGKNLALSYAEVAANFYTRGFFKAAKVATGLSKANRRFLYIPFYVGIEMLKLARRLSSFTVLRRNYSTMNLKKDKMIRKLISLFSKDSTKKHFTEIYHKNVWQDKDSRSGSGSNLAQTEVIRREIPKLIKEFGVEVFIDAPCGDFFWMNMVNLSVRKYIGIDIVDDMIAQNNKKYADEQREFLCRDIINDDLPPADLILCRDCLVHLTFEQAQNAIKNFKRNGIKYLLCTTFVDRDSNIDLPEHIKWRTLNMQLPPFNFPRPLKLINEACTEENNSYIDKSLGLWRVDDL